MTQRYRAAALYSSICAVKSRGYEIVTSVIFPLASVTGVSFGITNPVYDGTFSGRRIAAMGVTARALSAAGVRLFDETELEQADALLRSLDARD